MEVNRNLDGPCRRESKFKIFTIEANHWHRDCMNLCQKLGGRSPPVRTLHEWQEFVQEVETVSPFMSNYSHPIWLSATEGGEGMELGRLSHWTKDVRSQEGVWRDYNTGHELENYSKPWAFDFEDTKEGNTSNCLLYYPDWISWKEWNCFALQRGCPCTFDSPPVLQLRGSVCKSSYIKPQRYTLRQSLRDPKTVIMVGLISAQIFVWDTNWILRDAPTDVTAWSHASKESFSLGKHNWTVLDPGCSGDQITLEMKLTGCQQKGEFTCNDGQCIRMEERCNQLPNCRDKSNRNARFFFSKMASTKGFLQFHITGNEKTKTKVDVSINLLKVVSVEEEESATR